MKIIQNYINDYNFVINRYKGQATQGIAQAKKSNRESERGCAIPRAVPSSFQP